MGGLKAYPSILAKCFRSADRKVKFIGGDATGISLLEKDLAILSHLGECQVSESSKAASVLFVHFLRYLHRFLRYPNIQS